MINVRTTMQHTFDTMHHVLRTHGPGQSYLDYENPICMCCTWIYIHSCLYVNTPGYGPLFIPFFLPINTIVNIHEKVQKSLAGQISILSWSDTYLQHTRTIPQKYRGAFVLLLLSSLSRTDWISFYSIYRFSSTNLMTDPSSCSLQL